MPPLGQSCNYAVLAKSGISTVSENDQKLKYQMVGPNSLDFYVEFFYVY